MDCCDGENASDRLMHASCAALCQSISSNVGTIMRLFSKFIRPAPEDVTGEVYWGKGPKQPGVPLQNGKVKGWAYDARRSVSLAVQLRIDGAVVSSTAGGLVRERLKDPNEARSGFTITVPKSVHGDGLHHYEVCVADTDILVPNGAFIASLDEQGELVELDYAEGSPVHRLLLPWYRPSSEAGGLAAVKLLVADGLLDDACESLRNLYNAEPSSTMLLERLSRVCFTAGRYDEVLAALECLLAQDPNNVAALERRVRVLIKLGRTDELPPCLESLESSAPQSHDLYKGWFDYHEKHKNWRLALEWLARYFRLLEDQPTEGLRIVSQGVELCHLLNDLDTAVDLTAEGVAKFPTHAGFRQLRGDLLFELGRIAEAKVVCEEALAIDRKHLKTHMRLATIDLLEGRFDKAFDTFERRRAPLDYRETEPLPGIPQWGGQLDLSGAVLVWSEDEVGLEATLLNLAFIPPLTDVLGLSVVLAVEEHLFELAQRSFPGVRVIRKQELPNYNPRSMGVVQKTPLGSLVRFFRRRRGDFRFSRPYLVENQERRRNLRQTLVADTPTRLIGIELSAAEFKDLSPIYLSHICQALQLPDVRFVCFELPSGIKERPVQAASSWTLKDHTDDVITDISGTTLSSTIDQPKLNDEGALESDVLFARDILNSDMDEFAALTAAMDVFVSAGNSFSHLAGALGVPGVVILPPVPAAHWLAEGEECLWYCNTTIVRRLSDEADPYHTLNTVHDCVVRLLDEPRPPRSERRAPHVNADEVETYLDNFLKVVLRAKKRALADPIIKRLLKLRPDDPDLLLEQGNTALSLGDHPTAVAAFSALCERGLFPDDAADKLTLALLSDYRVEDGLQVLADIEASDRQVQPHLLFLAAAAASDLNDQQSAREICKRLLASSLADGEQRLNIECLLARVLRRAGDMPAAQAVLAATLSRSPEAVDAWLEEGLLASNIGDLDRAVEAFSNARRPPRAAVAETLKVLCQTDPLYAGAAVAGPGIKVPALQGALPSVGPDDLVLFACCDAVYWKEHAAALVRSAAANAPNTPVHIHIVNPDGDSIAGLDHMQRKLAPSRFSWSSEYVDMEGTEARFAPVYYASIRFLRLYQIAARRPANYLCIDADGVVRRPLDGVLEETGQCDVALRRRLLPMMEMRVAAGVMLVRPTAGALRFLRLVASPIKDILESGSAAWYLDQVVITNVLDGHVHRGRFSVGQLSASYIDWRFHPDSAIWTGKGDRKARNENYVFEKSLYLEDALVHDLAPNDHPALAEP